MTSPIGFRNDLTFVEQCERAAEAIRPRSRGRRERIEALGDSNPPGMAEVIGIAIKEAVAA